MPDFLYLLRHGEAVDLDADGGLTDAQRYLTRLGEKQSRRAGKIMAHQALVPDVVWTSPLVRAKETAQAFAEAFDTPPPIVLMDVLAPGGNRSTLLAAVAACGAEELVLVGHEPDLGELIYHLVCGGEGAIEVSKGSLTCLKMLPGTRPGPNPSASLHWSMHAKTIKALV